MKHTIKIQSVEADAQKFIISARWRAEFFEDTGEHVGFESGIVYFEPSEEFVPFDTITEEDMLAWMEPKLDLVAFYEACISRREQEQEQTPAVQEFTPPWQGGAVINSAKRTARK